MTDEKYFNFPIVLLQGFMKDSKKVLNDIFDYALHQKASEYLNDSKEEFSHIETADEAMRITENYFGVTTGDKKRTFKNGKALNDSLPDGLPMVGINKDVFFDYYKNEKSEFEKVCLLGFLGIKSILQNKAYCKMTNKYWLARMDGKVKAVNNYSELSRELIKYANEYQTGKIKFELIENWNLEHYSRYTRGFYVSFKLKLEELIYQAESKRKSTKENQRKFSEKVALERVLNRLNPGGS